MRVVACNFTSPVVMPDIHAATPTRLPLDLCAAITVLALRLNRSDEVRCFLLGRKPSARRQLVDDFGQLLAKAI